MMYVVRKFQAILRVTPPPRVLSSRLPKPVVSGPEIVPEPTPGDPHQGLLPADPGRPTDMVAAADHLRDADLLMGRTQLGGRNHLLAGAGGGGASALRGSRTIKPRHQDRHHEHRRKGAGG